MVIYAMAGGAALCVLVGILGLALLTADQRVATSAVPVAASPTRTRRSSSTSSPTASGGRSRA
ncbi:hypothetical protein [Actinomadura madurae]|uniref:hypothetical protein n=1 Tax=Actinomadura madurae TaxID=1993 RepID=UPI0020D23C30|nr:hypothetical protein [Actinomadura madurae]MCP9950200.1 hypothetical protein [Actinomadura madurae]MCP9966968.1 hypothetical protein [Actinomadura madurae]MCP9979439.1 hypothetical protein [Actinomadura madurae]MCQ0009031.1 hypothetical protein [Actinomadura madurae]MCQ0015647.1 hypothetical protein [Actinomadura madurae]